MQVAIHGDGDFTGGSLEACCQGSRLSIGLAKLNDAHAGIDLGDSSEQGKSLIGTSVIDKNDLKCFTCAIGEALQFNFQLSVEFRNRILFIKHGNNYGIQRGHTRQSLQLLFPLWIGRLSHEPN